MAQQTYNVDGFHIVDSQKDQRFYIREILDMGCAEYTFSQLSAAKKLNIIHALGLQHLTKVLAACFAHANKPYLAETEANTTYHALELQKEFEKQGRVTGLSTGFVDLCVNQQRISS